MVFTRILGASAFARHFEVWIAAALVTEYAYVRYIFSRLFYHGWSASAGSGDRRCNNKMSAILVGIENRFGSLSQPKWLLHVEGIRSIPIGLCECIYRLDVRRHRLPMSLNGVGRLHPALAMTRSRPPSFSLASLTILRHESRLLTSPWIATHPFGRVSRASCALAAFEA
jgi:hypothetical protein